MRRRVLFLTAPEECGVYYIFNTVNDRLYFGATSNVRRRFKLHYNQLMNNKHHNTALQDDWNDYGPSAFAFKTILTHGMLGKGRHDHRLDEYEDALVEICKTDDPRHGYNLYHFDRKALHKDIKSGVVLSRRARTRKEATP